MSANFSFPPPPPPPPKATPAQTSQPEGQSRGRGRGRGGFRGGQHKRGAPYSNGVGHQQSSPDAQRPPFGQQQGRPAPYSTFAHRQSGNGISDIPTGSYVNRNFTSQSGLQNGHSAGSQQTQHTQPPKEVSSQLGGKAGSPPRTAAGHKRKLDALCPAQKDRKPAPQTAPTIPSFGAPLLPSKPPAVAHVSNISPRTAATVEMKQTSRVHGKSLGLIPSAARPQSSSSDSDEDDRDVDEEAMFVELGDKLTFEHNGVVMSLSSQADLAAWQKERKKNWPTRSRMAERDEERRKVGEERKRLLATGEVLKQASRSGAAKSRNHRGHGLGSKRTEATTDVKSEQIDTITAKTPESNLDKARREMDEQTRRLDELRRRVKESEARNRKAKAQQEGEDDSTFTKSYITGTTLDQVTDIQDQPEQDEELEHDSNDSDLDSEDSTPLESSSVLSSGSSDGYSSDDGPPEEITSKPQAIVLDRVEMWICRRFAASGYCRDGDACRFKHELQPEAIRTAIKGATETRKSLRGNTADRPPRLDQRSSKKSIYDRLVEQEQRAEDRLALKVIKYLGKAGFFSESSFVNEEE